MRHAMAETHTFLFCDLVGFTALTAAEGDDRGAEVATELCERTRPLLPEHRAEHVKSIGDALMLRSDDAALGMRLGLRIVDELEQVQGFPPARVGMHSGPAVTRNGDWFGTTVNVAARLCAVAGGGQVLASEATVAAAGGMRGIDIGEPHLHWLKNVTDPVAARSLAVSERIGRFAAGVAALERLFAPTAGSTA
jgi:class 3 adenylate cyclase